MLTVSLDYTEPAPKTQGEHSLEIQKPCAHRQLRARKRIREITEGSLPKELI